MFHLLAVPPSSSPLPSDDLPFVPSAPSRTTSTLRIPVKALLQYAATALPELAGKTGQARQAGLTKGLRVLKNGEGGFVAKRRHSAKAAAGAGVPK